MPGSSFEPSALKRRTGARRTKATMMMLEAIGRAWECGTGIQGTSIVQQDYEEDGDCVGGG